MRRVTIIGLLILFTLVVLINTVDLSFSISTYEIKTEGDYYMSGGTNVRLTGIYCKSLVGSDGTTKVYRDNSELIKIPNNVSNYLFKIKYTGSSNNNLKESNCNIIEYNAPLMSTTCTSNSIGSDESAYCDIYLTTSSYGLEKIDFVKLGDNLSITDFQSNYFNIQENNNSYSFIPKDELLINKKYLVGTIRVTNISVADGVTNDLILSNIKVKDTITSFSIADIKYSFMEGIIDDNSKLTTTTTTTAKAPSPKTNIEYKNNNKNESNKVKVRNIILLFLFVIFISISLGFIAVFLLREK
ncbi:MAG: hypothetical protein IJS56_00860 [Bacilli bacterium]|nr:hypothetical protein [Bacilli bacterium]